MTDEVRSLGKGSLEGKNSGNSDSTVADASGSPVFGLAICDTQLRYKSVNNALAAMNGVSSEAHYGKTLRGVIGELASPVELMLRTVLVTGHSILNAEIMGKLPTRKTEGYWILNCFPLRDSTGDVGQVGVLVTEITSLRRLENCILTLMGNNSRTTGEFNYLGKPYPLETETDKLWSGSIESVEITVRELLNNIHRIEQSSEAPHLGNSVLNDRLPLSNTSFASSDKASSAERGSIVIADRVSQPLSERETELVRLIAQAKTTKEISALLKISTRTVEAYRDRVRLKLHLRSTTDIVHYAIRQGLVKL